MEIRFSAVSWTTALKYHVCVQIQACKYVFQIGAVSETNHLCEESRSAGRTRGVPFPISAGKLIPAPHHFDDGVACPRFALDFAGNLARALVFVYANRRHHFLLPPQGLHPPPSLKRRDGHHPMRWLPSS